MKSYSTEELLLKIRRFCAYQERCHSEVRDKLYSLGCHTSQVQQIMSDLIEKNFLNEERFAEAYASGKFRIKHWGRIRIKNQLRLKGVSDYCIKKGLSAIDEREYTEVLTSLAEKQRSLKIPPGKNGGYNQLAGQAKVMAFLISRGFEPDLVKDILGGETNGG